MDLRSKRVRKFRTKNRPLEIMIKLTIICYIVIFSVSYLTTGTSAYFSDIEEINPVIIAGEWEQWDESSLGFTTKGNQNIKQCPAEIEVKLKNVGDGDMQDDSTYDIYYVTNGNPEKHGEKIELDEKEGIIKPLKKGEETTLTYETNKSGVYVFLAYQHEKHPEEEEAWSKWIKVDCLKVKPSTVKENKQNTTTNEEVDNTTEIIEKRDQPETTEDQVKKSSKNEETNGSKAKTEPKPDNTENAKEDEEEHTQSSVKEDKEFEDS